MLRWSCQNEVLFKTIFTKLIKCVNIFKGSLNKPLKETIALEEKDMVAWVREDRNRAITEIYRQYRDEFVQFSQKYGVVEEDRLDAFQEGVIAFYEYCYSGRYDQSRSSPKTMVFNMAKYALINMKKKQGKLVSVPDTHLTTREKEGVVDLLNENLTHQQHLIKRGLSHLGEQCQAIIRLFYFCEYSIEAIVRELGYQNENVVRSHKSRCLKKLREHLKMKNSGTK